MLGNNPDISYLTDNEEKEVSKYTNLRLSKCIASVGLNMKEGLCAYSFKHSSLIKDIKSLCESDSGRYLAGDYFEGVSIEGCFRSGYKTAKIVSTVLKPK